MQLCTKILLCKTVVFQYFYFPVTSQILYQFCSVYKLKYACASFYKCQTRPEM